MTMKEIIKWLAGIFPKRKNQLTKKNDEPENRIAQEEKLIQRHGNKPEFII
jgi:hypothetical protein